TCTLYCTTFPCHICAKHIIASAIMRVVYLEPYPKSYAWDLHRDSIELEKKSTTRTSSSEPVSFEHFIGVSPMRYKNLFEKGKRKVSGGSAQAWYNNEKRPMIEVYYPSYFPAETRIVASLDEGIGKIKRKTISESGTARGTLESETPG